LRFPQTSLILSIKRILWFFIWIIDRLIDIWLS
jgi:hypothetical protein